MLCLVFRSGDELCVAHDDRCDLGARSGVLRSDRVVRHAVDDADGDRPAQGLLRVVTDPGGVGEFLGKVSRVADIETAEFCEAVEDRDDLLTRDLVVRGEQAVADAVDDLVLRAPVHGCGVPRAGRNVGERRLADVVGIRGTGDAP